MNAIAAEARLEVRRIDHAGLGGRGVFATVPFAKGLLIERCPVLVLPANEIFAADGAPATRLTSYVFDWRDIAGGEFVGLALGFGSLYNHRILANATWTAVSPDLLEIHAARDIAAGDEVSINYNGEPGDAEPAPFERQPPASHDLSS